MIRFLLSPTESKLAEISKDQAIVSPIPEQKGADVLIYFEAGSFGIQRKKLPGDFISSFTDGRLTQKLPLLRDSCTFSRLVCEGRFKYWPDNTVDLGMTRDHKRVPSRFTRKMVHGMLNDVEMQFPEIPIRWTENEQDTFRYIESVINYFSEKKHVGLYRRPKVKGIWNVPTANELHLWILQSFPGIGPSMADAIMSHFGGNIPLMWSCTLKELERVPKLDVKRAKQIWDTLELGAVRQAGPGEARLKEAKPESSATPDVYGTSLDYLRLRLKGVM